MSSSSVAAHSNSGGFSLLEMVVAIALLAIALGYLYQAAGGATRNVHAQETYAHAVELARSLLAEHSSVPEQGIALQGLTQEGLSWELASTPVRFARTSSQTSRLHSVVVKVSWSEGLRRREVDLQSVVGVAGK